VTDIADMVQQALKAVRRSGPSQIDCGGKHASLTHNLDLRPYLEQASKKSMTTPPFEPESSNDRILRHLSSQRPSLDKLAGFCVTKDTEPLSVVRLRTRIRPEAVAILNGCSNVASPSVYLLSSDNSLGSCSRGRSRGWHPGFACSCKLYAGGEA
jgi:hypothetical protein